MDVIKPYECIGLGAMDVTKPYEFIGFGGMGMSMEDRREETNKQVHQTEAAKETSTRTLKVICGCEAVSVLRDRNPL